MLISLEEQLRHLGAVVDRPARRPSDLDGLIQVQLDGADHLFAVEQRLRAPYPSELSTLQLRRVEIAQWGSPLLVAPYISERLGNELLDHGWSWADEAGNFDLRAPEFRVRQRLSNSPPPRRSRSIPLGEGALRIIRFLIYESRPETHFGPTELAQIAGAGVTQARVSQVLSQLQKAEVVERRSDGWFTRREELLDAFMRDYRGPGGSEHYFYSLDPPQDVALAVVRSFSAPRRLRDVAVSADVGPDLIHPWRRPSQVIVYTRSPVDLRKVELVPAQSRSDATLLLRVPNDTSMFRFKHLTAEVQGLEVPLADEPQMIWDLHDLGGDDRIEAADRLRQWLLNTH